ncbi:hypothetical protein [Leucobacter chromiireducens]|uniref:hypothetical protein n=1 Tax=Leucobacter chromiireducens TaxID=283877 RepID=UPI001925DD82|nr:hypothetical protein [Leucobacter chromiireducens]
MTLTAPTGRRWTRPRPAEIVFLGFGAAVFTLATVAAATICVVCAYPATVGPLN